MPAVLLDGSRGCPRCGKIPARPRRFAGADSERRNFALDRGDFSNGRMKISAVLLAGGKSRRMGQDKATLIIAGKPLWQIQLDLLRKLQPQEMFVSARMDPRWRPNDVEFVADEQPSRG